MSKSLHHPFPTLHKNAAGVYDLMPGDVAVGYAGEHLKTLLGSCVAVILTDARRTVAAMCHIVHVGQPSAGNRHSTAYGTNAMEDMFQRLQQLGVRPQMCEAYVFGGGNMFPKLFTVHHVGSNNANWVLQQLKQYDIPVVSQCLGGQAYRKVSWTVGPTEPVVEVVTAESGLSDGR